MQREFRFITKPKAAWFRSEIVKNAYCNENCFTSKECDYYGFFPCYNFESFHFYRKSKTVFGYKVVEKPSINWRNMIWRNEQLNLWLRKSERVKEKTVFDWCYSVKGRATAKWNHGMWLFGDIFRCSLSRQPPLSCYVMLHIYEIEHETIAKSKTKTTNRLFAGDSHKHHAFECVCVCDVLSDMWFAICKASIN